MKYPNPNMLLYIACADACAAAVEYLDKNPGADHLLTEALELTHYVARPLGDIPAGHYTDDTEMSIANALVLLNREQPYQKQHFVHAYLREFAYGGRREGYARGFYQFLCSVQNTEDFLARIRPDSTANGAAMRAVPLGALPDVRDALAVAQVQARLTHDTPAGIVSAQYVAYLSWMSLWSEVPLAELCTPARPVPWHLFDDPQYAAQLVEYFRKPWLGIPVHKDPYGCPALTTVHAVVHLLREEHSLMDILRRTMQWGGDTDSVAAIAWGIASARYQDEVLPAFLERDLEGVSARTGAVRLRTLGRELMRKFTRT